jgi:hypothetical protein
MRTSDVIDRGSFERAKQKTPDGARQAPIEGYIADYESSLPAAAMFSKIKPQDICNNDCLPLTESQRFQTAK